MEFESTVRKQSTRYPGVEFVIARMSLGRRIALGERIREAGLKGEFLAASDRAADQVEVAVLHRQIEKIYLEWGLLSVHGLRIDAQNASPQSLIERGPEDLTGEILTAIRAELQLSEAERKN